MSRAQIHILIMFIVMPALGVFSVQPLLQAQCKPMLIPGKTTLFQRVVSHPGAYLHRSASASERLDDGMLDSFSVLYVYERKMVGNDEWLKVGFSSNCETVGWIDAKQASDWRQSLTLVFTERTGRRPVLFFNSLNDLEQVAGSADPTGQVSKLIDDFNAIQAGQTQASESFPVLALEPAKEAVSRQRFYMMPIFATAELYEGVKFLQIASIDPGSWRLPGDPELRTAIVFVIDTTISMKPYIDRTREAVRRIYDQIQGAGLDDKVAFGLVAYRSSTLKTPGLQYASKVYSNLRDGRRRADFEQALEQVKEAGVSSHSFNEDAFAGIKTAIDAMDWSNYQSRLIFLITDAGAIRNDDPNSITGMNEAQIADLSASKGIKIFVLHLKTPAGRKFGNHTLAETQYRALTGQSDPSIGDLYVPIDAGGASGGVETFGQIVEGVSEQMIELVRASSKGERLELADQPAGGGSGVVVEAKRKAAVLGYAMQLEFLGSQSRTRAPQVVTAWASDMDLARPDIPAFQVTVLLTKNQLSDLYQRLRIILDQAQRTKRTGAKDFFKGILSATAQISRDPKQFSAKPNERLGDLGLLGELIDDLPYRSAIMRLTEEDWYRMSVGEQQAIIDDLKSKIKRYELYHNDVSNWVSFGSSDPGDTVYRVPLAMMP
jgi:serine/threonine-protein kinase PpkA